MDRYQPAEEGTLTMPILIEKRSRITAAGNKPKIIDEFIGRVNPYLQGSA